MTFQWRRTHGDAPMATLVNAFSASGIMDGSLAFYDAAASHGYYTHEYG